MELVKFVHSACGHMIDASEFIYDTNMCIYPTYISLKDTVYI